MPAPRIAAIHDLSCFGRCSLTIALPVLSAMGCQCCPLPTALLSAHTGISGFTFLDTTDEMRRISAHWSQLSLHFQAIYTGFLGSAPQINLVEDFLRRFHAPDTLLVMDPVMGDHGTPYKTCTPALRQGLRELVAQADVITPNPLSSPATPPRPGRWVPCAMTGTPGRWRPFKQPEFRRISPAPATCLPACSPVR